MTEQTPRIDDNNLTQTPLPQDDGFPGPAAANIAQTATGYHVEMLAVGAERSSVRTREALSIDRAARAEQFATAFVDRTIASEVVGDAWSQVESGRPGFVVFYRVPEEEVDAAGVPRDLFVDGKFQHPGTDKRQKLVDAGDQAGLADFDQRAHYAQVLDASITPQRRHEQVAAYYGQQPQAIERLYRSDMSGVEQAETGMENLLQAFELTDSVDGEEVGSIRVLNLTGTGEAGTEEAGTVMTEEHVADIAKALRYFSERTGGAIYDRFDNIVIIPKNHPSLTVRARQADGTMREMKRRGYMAPRTLVMSEWVLYPPEEQPPATVEGTAFFHSYLRPDEPAAGPGSPVMTVAQGRFRATVAHEMTHMCLFERDIPVARSLYSRFNPVEHDAELGAAQYLGEDHLVPADEDELAAFEHKWQWLRAKAERDGRPQGDHFVDAREHDLTAGPLPRRLKQPGKPLLTEVTYRLQPSEQAPQPAA